MKTLFAALLPVLILAGIGRAQGPTRLGVINMQSAVVSTKEGQKVGQDLQNKFMPRRQALEKRQSDLGALQSRMRAGSATMSQPAREKLMADIDAKTKDFNRDSQDFNDEVTQEQGRLMGEIGQKMLQLIEKFATQHGIFMVVDVSGQQSPVLWFEASLDITPDIIKMYDEAHPPAK